MYKRIISTLLLLTMCLGLLNGCKTADKEEDALTDQYIDDLGEEIEPEQNFQNQQPTDQGTIDNNAAGDQPETQQPSDHVEQIIPDPNTGNVSDNTQQNTSDNSDVDTPNDTNKEPEKESEKDGQNSSEKNPDKDSESDSKEDTEKETEKKPQTESNQNSAAVPEKDSVTVPGNNDPITTPEKDSATAPETNNPATTPEKDPVTGPENNNSVTTPEKDPVTVPENTPATTPDRNPVTVPGNTPVTTPEKDPVTVPEKTPATTPEKDSVTGSEKNPATTPEKDPVTVPENTPVTKPEAEQKPETEGDGAPVRDENTPSVEQAPPGAGTGSGNSGDAGDTGAPSAEEALTNLYYSSTLSTAIGYDGKNNRDSDYTVSKPFEVRKGDIVTFGPMASSQVVMGYIYNQGGKPVQIINAHTARVSATFMGGMNLYTYTVPADGSSVKFSVHNDSKNEFVVTRNNEFDLTEYTKLAGIPADFVNDPLKNKDGLFVGDSICIATRDEKVSGMRGWPRRIADEYGLNAVNNGKSGVSVSNKRSQGTVLTQLLEKKTQDFDYVVLHGGVNDAWSLVDVGVMEDGFDPIEFDPATFGGGLELLIYNAILYYGDTASIGYLINFKAPACEKGTVKDMTAYNELAKKICDKWGITYFDMYNHEEITQKLKMDTLANTTDYIHPSSSGYDIISPYIAEYMKTMLPCKQEILEVVLAK